MSLRTTSSSSEHESLDDALESKTLPRLMVGVIVMVALIYLTSDYDLYGGSEGAAPTGGPTGAFFLVLLIHAALYALGPHLCHYDYEITKLLGGDAESPFAEMFA